MVLRRAFASRPRAGQRRRHPPLQCQVVIDDLGNIEVVLLDDAISGNSSAHQEQNDETPMEDIPNLDDILCTSQEENTPGPKLDETAETVLESDNEEQSTDSPIPSGIVSEESAIAEKKVEQEGKEREITGRSIAPMTEEEDHHDSLVIPDMSQRLENLDFLDAIETDFLDQPASNGRDSSKKLDAATVVRTFLLLTFWIGQLKAAAFINSLALEE